MKEFVTAEPYQTATQLNGTETHLIIACDGVWDVISDQTAVELILREANPQKASEKLLKASLEQGSTDNISVIVIQLI